MQLNFLSIPRGNQSFIRYFYTLDNTPCKQILHRKLRKKGSNRKNQRGYFQIT